MLRKSSYGSVTDPGGPGNAASGWGIRSGRPILAQVLFRRGTARKRDFNDSNWLHNSDLGASSNDSDTYRKCGLEPGTNGECGEAAQTRMGSGFAAH
jgi:hypothetical protein